MLVEKPQKAIKMRPIGSLLGTQHKGWTYLNQQMIPERGTTAAHWSIRDESNAENRFHMSWNVMISGTLTFKCFVTQASPTSPSTDYN